MVGEEGIEPSLLAEHDFESCAYTSSATHPRQNRRAGFREFIQELTFSLESLLPLNFTRVC